MRKFAFILMGPEFTPDTHQARFETKRGLTAIYTVRDYEEAKQRVLACAAEGYGAIELCGAFGEEKARELIALTQGRMGVGFVTHLPEQDELINAFFCG